MTKEKATMGSMAAGKAASGDGFKSIIPHEHPQKNLQNCAVAYAKLGWAVLPLFGIKNGHCACGKKDSVWRSIRFFCAGHRRS